MASGSPKRNPLIFVGGHPGVGKTELAGVVARMFNNVKVVEFREFLRDAAKKAGLKAVYLTSEQQRQLIPRIRRRLNRARRKSTVVLLGHFVHPWKVPPRRQSDHVDVRDDQFLSYISEKSKRHKIDADAYVFLDSETSDLIERASSRKKEKGIGERFLHKSTAPIILTQFAQPKGKSKQQLAVERRRYAEFLEAHLLSRERNRPLYTIPVNTRFILPAQTALFWVLMSHGGKPDTFWKTAMERRAAERGLGKQYEE